MSCISAQDPQLTRLANAIAQRVGAQRFSVWFNNSTKLDLKQDGLEIAVPNDFISEWIGKNFARPIQEAAQEVLGCALHVRFSVVPQLFAVKTTDAAADDDDEDGPELDPRHIERLAHRQREFGHDRGGAAVAVARPASTNLRPLLTRTNGSPTALAEAPAHRVIPAVGEAAAAGPAATTDGKWTQSALASRSRLRHDIETFVVGASNQLAYNTALYVAEFPGAQYNPLFIHGGCGLGKTHLLQGLCRRFIRNHPTKRWAYLTGEEFTNEFLGALKANKLDLFRRRVRDLDLLVIDDVHFLGGKKATQEEFLHTFNAIEAMGKQVVMASDNHPKMIEEFGESLINRFVSGMVVRIDPPNYGTRCEILRTLCGRLGLTPPEEVIGWIARRVTQNVRELEGAVTRIAAQVRLSGQMPDVAVAQAALGDLDRQMVAPVKPDSVLAAVCDYFGVEERDLMSGRRQRTVSLARSVAMYLVRRTAKLSFPEIGQRMGKRNHSTVISACRRIERAVQRNEQLVWTSAVGDREEEAAELLQRLEEHSRTVN